MTAPLPPAVLAGLRERAKAAGDDAGFEWYNAASLGNVLFAGTGSGDDVAISEDFDSTAVAEHIAAADPQTVEALVDEVEALRRIEDRARWLLSLKDGPRDDVYRESKDAAWDDLRAALAPAETTGAES